MPSENFEAVEDLNDFTSRALMELGDRPRGEGGISGEDEVVDPTSRAPVQEPMNSDFPMPPEDANEIDQPAAAASTAVAQSSADGGEDDVAPPVSDEEAAQVAVTVQPDDFSPEAAAVDMPEPVDFFQSSAMETVEEFEAQSEQQSTPAAEQHPQATEPISEPAPQASPPAELLDPPDYFDQPEFQTLTMGAPDVRAADSTSRVDQVSAPASPIGPPVASQPFSPDVDALGRQSGPLPAEDLSSVGRLEPEFDEEIPEFRSADQFGAEFSSQNMRAMAKETLSPMFEDVNRTFVGMLGDEMTLQNELMRSGKLY